MIDRQPLGCMIKLFSGDSMQLKSRTYYGAGSRDYELCGVHKILLNPSKLQRRFV
jgi:hypothetical protein